MRDNGFDTTPRRDHAEVRGERGDGLFSDRLDRFGDSPALLFDDGPPVSYRELAARVARFGRALGEQRRLILVETTQSLDTIVAYLAALAARHPVILSEVGHEDTTAELVATFEVDALVAPDGSIRSLRDRRDPEPHRLHPELALLLSTSGSTGSAKLVRLSRANLESNAAAIVSYLEIAPDDVGALTLPLHYSYGLSILNSHLYAGASVYVSNTAITSPAILDRLAAVACTNLSGVPTSYEIFERIGLRRRRLPSLRFMTAAGGRLPPDVARTYARHLEQSGGRFYVMYGQTEAAPRIAYLPPEAALDHADCIGVPVPGGELHLVDDQGARIEGTGVSGELVYRGPNVMMGYATTAADLARAAELDELRTGDLAELTDAGFYRIVGRRSRFSKLGGFRVSHDDVERRLREAGIAAVATGDDEGLVIAVADRDLVDRASRRILEVTNVTPAQLAVLAPAQLPLLTTGKPDYKALLRLARGELEQPPTSVLEAFRKAFWPKPVEPSDSFVSLGGDSLTYVELVVALEGLLGAAPGSWETTRISQLAEQRALPGRWSRVDPTVYLRAGAVLLVVLHHLTRFGFRGGAFVLLVLVGYSLARFQAQALFGGRVRDVARQALRNLALYYLVLVCWLLWERVFRWQDLLLLSNILASSHPQIAYSAYWFMEAYAFIVAVVVAVFSVPSLRRRIASRPFESGVVALLATLALVYAGRLLWQFPWHTCWHGRCEPVSEVAYWPAIGWCLYFAGTAGRRWLTVLLATACVLGVVFLSYGVWLGPVRWALYLGTFWLLSFRVSLPLPPVMSRPLSLIAADSYAIYLLHLVPLAVLVDLGTLPASGSARELLLVLAGLGLPLIAMAGLRRFEASRLSVTRSAGA